MADMDKRAEPSLPHGDNIIMENNEQSVLEQNIGNLILNEKLRNSEIDARVTMIEEQKMTMEELRKNRNAILLDTHLLERKTLEERTARDDATAMAQDNEKMTNMIRVQLAAASKNLNELNAYKAPLETIYDAITISKSANMSAAVEAEKYRLLLKQSSETVRNKINEERKKTMINLKNQLEQLDLNNVDVERVIFPGEDQTDASAVVLQKNLLEILTQQRKAVSLQAEKNKSLKKLKKEREERCKKGKEKIKKINENIMEVQKEVNTLRDKCDTESRREADMTGYITQVRLKVEECLKSLTETKKDLENNYVTMAEKQAGYGDLLEAEAKLKESLIAIEKDEENRKENMKMEIQNIANCLSKVESERLMLEGRILEVIQQHQILSDELGTKIEHANSLRKEKELLERDLMETTKQCEEESAKDKEEICKLENILVVNGDKKAQDQKLQELKVLVSEKLVKVKNDLATKLQLIEGERTLVSQKEEMVKVLRNEIEQLTASLKDTRDMVTLVSKQKQITDDNRNLISQGRELYEKICVEIEAFDAEAAKTLSEQHKILEITKETARSTHTQFEHLQQALYDKKGLTEKNNEEINNLKLLVLECEANLAQETQEKEKLESKLCVKRAEREKDEKLLQEAEELELKRKREETRLKDQKRKEGEVKVEENSFKKEAISERHEMEGEHQMCFRKKNKENNEDIKWMDMIRKTKVKTESLDDYPDMFFTPLSASTNTSGKKFFKSRHIDPQRPVPIYAKKTKKAADANLKNVFDYESDDSVQCLYVGPTLAGTSNRKAIRKK